MTGGKSSFYTHFLLPPFAGDGLILRRGFRQGSMVEEEEGRRNTEGEGEQRMSDGIDVVIVGCTQAAQICDQTLSRVVLAQPWKGPRGPGAQGYRSLRCHRLSAHEEGMLRWHGLL